MLETWCHAQMTTISPVLISYQMTANENKALLLKTLSRALRPTLSISRHEHSWITAAPLGRSRCGHRGGSILGLEAVRPAPRPSESELHPQSPIVQQLLRLCLPASGDREPQRESSSLPGPSDLRSQLLPAGSFQEARFGF